MLFTNVLGLPCPRSEAPSPRSEAPSPRSEAEALRPLRDGGGGEDGQAAAKRGRTGRKPLGATAGGARGEGGAEWGSGRSGVGLGA